VTINGTCYAGSEIWSTGFYMGAAGSDAIAPNEAFMTALDTAWRAFWTAPNSMFSSEYQTASYRVAIINEDGTTDVSTVLNKYLVTPVNGGTTTANLPPQCSIVATLQTDTPRGLGSKGRMYLPGIGVSIAGNTGTASTSTLQNTANNMKTFFNAINGSFDQPGKVITASKGRTVGLVGGMVNRPITSVKIGNVYDTQRRRRNQLVEQFVTATGIA
jgi:hypothetical protein